MSAHPETQRDKRKFSKKASLENYHNNSRSTRIELQQEIVSLHIGSCCILTYQVRNNSVKHNPVHSIYILLNNLDKNKNDLGNTT